MTVYTTIGSPLGDLLLAGERSATAPGGVALSSVSMPGQRNAPRPPDRSSRPQWQRDDEAFAGIARQFEAYFAGASRGFDIEFTPTGTEFQQRVWQAVDGIPYGSTTTYGKLAGQLGVPRDRIQAVGAAIGANPLLIVRPCHRVIGADGGMRGYAGGVERKQQLLVHEGALQPMLA
ncbi:MAG TPA: methylated-DNA--[protein]-cysteine S-methyltransferase [Actinocrinis sp.]